MTCLLASGMAPTVFADSQAGPLCLKALQVLAHIPSNSKIHNPCLIRKLCAFFLLAHGEERYLSFCPGI